MSHTHFSLPLPFSLHSISTYPPTPPPLPTVLARPVVRFTPLPHRWRTTEPAWSASRASALPPPLPVPCSLPTPVAELRPSPPRGARPPSNRRRIRRIHVRMDPAAARFDTSPPRGAPPPSLRPAVARADLPLPRPVAARARASSGASFCTARWRGILLKDGGRRPHHRRAAA
jgi:hypothetical protein